MISTKINWNFGKVYPMISEITGADCQKNKMVLLKINKLLNLEDI